MVTKCNHLNEGKKQMILGIFEIYESLFSGKLGRVPGPLVKIRLKPGAKAFFAQAYSVPQTFMSKEKKEVIEDLNKSQVKIHVFHHP